MNNLASVENFSSSLFKAFGILLFGTWNEFFSVHFNAGNKAGK